MKDLQFVMTPPMGSPLKSNSMSMYFPCWWNAQAYLNQSNIGLSIANFVNCYKKSFWLLMISPWPNDKCALPVVYWSKSGNSKNLLSTMNLNYVLNSFFHSELKAKRDWQTSRRWWQTWQHDCMPTLHEDSYCLQIWRNCHSCWSWHFQKLKWKKWISS